MFNGEFDFHRIGKFFCLFIFRARKRLYHIKAPKHQKYTLTVSNIYKPSNYPERLCRIVFLVWEIFREVCSLLIRTSFSFYAQTTWEEPMLYLNGRRRIPKQTLYLKKTSILICLSPQIRHYLKGFFYNMHILVCVNMKFKYFIYLYIKDLFQQWVFCFIFLCSQLFSMKTLFPNIIARTSCYFLFLASIY